MLRFGWKLGREYGRRMSSYRGEYGPDYPRFLQDSAAAVTQDHNTPVPSDAPDIVYTKEDDHAIDEWLKAKSECYANVDRRDVSSYTLYSHDSLAFGEFTHYRESMLMVSMLESSLALAP